MTSLIAYPDNRWFSSDSRVSGYFRTRSTPIQPVTAQTNVVIKENSPTFVTTTIIFANRVVHDYALAATSHSIVKKLSENEFFASVPGLAGVWGSGLTEQMAKDDLLESIGDWVLLKIEDQDHDIPKIDNIDPNWL